MPVKIPASLPARDVLEAENVFLIEESRALHQDIRPLRIAILNLMPTKVATETQLLRLLGNTPLQVEVTLLHMASHASKNTSAEHLLEHYVSFEEVRHQTFDGLIVTGAPVETLPFEEVDYWPELTQILDWARTNVFSCLFICWGAQAALHRYYGIPKHPLPEKMFGVFPHHLRVANERLVQGFDDVFYAPHSRHTETRRADIQAEPRLVLLAESDEAGVYLVQSADRRLAFVTGHSEYDPCTLQGEYARDLGKGLPIGIPQNYFPEDDPTRPPQVRWRGHSNLLFSNWLNYFVYQETPFDLGLSAVEGGKA
ncbi:MAG: homoserine O-succinyltransferase [Geothrix sp.]|uniref:homoserine O-acetyltransferase MetA n=1 Tax=Geothrix sp. TaxID=1962974 RepID=UPI0017F765FA|nr:homoserine O-succinyltransferase [Geothrix sp.]NWJ41752.1 homoserine O-succinyltransferase [Geothrix sp.]WIL20269.1 MAG: homoserine O-succinyltransferase [Geothrix sp.]